jgi:hypothetical protein
MFKRFAYIGYYLKELDRKKLGKFIRYACARSGRSAAYVCFDMFRSSVRYNISLLEYFQFRFFELAHAERKTYAGTGFMYEYQLKMNPRGERKKLSDKVLFLEVYRNFVRHEYASLSALRQNPEKAERLLQAPSGKLVLKSSDGQCGRGIVVIDTKGLERDALLLRLEESGNDYVEEFIRQHESLNRLSPSGLNTVRVVTQLNQADEPQILGVRLRITVNSVVDNLAAGNIAASVDAETGRVDGPGVYSDITLADVDAHPVTGVILQGFQIPFWPETLAMIREAATTDTGNRSIGWDVAITREGPELIEGNHDWCKLLWQLPAKRGLKPLLEKYL